MAPANQLIESYLAERLPPGRGEEISLLIAGRSLLGMTVFTFVSQELLGMGRVLPVSDDDIVATLAEVFLRGVTGGRATLPA
jgi:hypothetical protein